MFLNRKFSSIIPHLPTRSQFLNVYVNTGLLVWYWKGSCGLILAPIFPFSKRFLKNKIGVYFCFSFFFFLLPKVRQTTIKINEDSPYWHNTNSNTFLWNTEQRYKESVPLERQYLNFNLGKKDSIKSRSTKCLQVMWAFSLCTILFFHKISLSTVSESRIFRE